MVFPRRKTVHHRTATMSRCGDNRGSNEQMARTHATQGPCQFCNKLVVDWGLGKVKEIPKIKNKLG